MSRPRLGRHGLLSGLVAAVVIVAAVGFVTRPGVDHDVIAHDVGASEHPVVRLDSVERSLYERTSQELLAMEADLGTRAALAELDRRVRTVEGLGGVCHAVAHDLGHQALTQAGDAVAEALSARDDVCGGGFTHGVVEAALGASTHPARDLLTVCAPSQDGSCFHGVGHGLMFATGMDVDRSLRLCGRAPSATLAARCGEGVFMQLFSADGAGGHTATSTGPVPTLSAARGICLRVNAPYSASCWFYAPTLWLAEHPDDFSGAIGWCRGAGSRLGRQLCVKGVGSRTIKYHPEDPRIGAAACAGAGGLVDSCLEGMASYWSVHFRGERAPGDVCRHLGDASLAKRCRAVT